MKKYIFITLFFAIGFVFVGDTQAQSVSGSINKARKGKIVSGRVILRIPGNLHVNSFKPKSQYAIPTRVSVSGSRGVRAYGVTYPPGVTRKFAFSDTPINVYEGRVAFGFKVRVPSNYRGKTIRVKASVKYQACTDEVCYPPKTKSVWITAPVR